MVNHSQVQRTGFCCDWVIGAELLENLSLIFENMDQPVCLYNIIEAFSVCCTDNPKSSDTYKPLFNLAHYNSFGYNAVEEGSQNWFMWKNDHTWCFFHIIYPILLGFTTVVYLPRIRILDPSSSVIEKLWCNNTSHSWKI